MRTRGARRLAWTKRALSALVATSGVAALGLVPGPARAIQQDASREATHLSASATPPLVAYAGSTKLTGELSAASGAVAGVLLDLASSTDGLLWSEPTAVTTDVDGGFTAQVTPDSSRRRTVYRITFAGTSEFAPAETRLAVDSRPDLSAPLAPVSVGRASSFEVSGGLRPRAPSGEAPITLACYRLEGRRWVLRKTVDAVVADSASASQYAARLVLPTAGAWRLRSVSARGTSAETWSPWSRRMTVGAAPDAPIWNRDGVTTIPERMASRLDARQLIVVTGRSVGSRNGTLRLFAYRDGDWIRTLAAPTRLGDRGLTDGLRRHAGSRTTPTGIWRLPEFVFGTHPRPPVGTRMAYRHITRRSWWSAERNRTYNTWVETARTVKGERLADYAVPYEFAFSSGYNARSNASVYGRGTAIFVHVFGRAYTAGCISVSRSNMIRLLRSLDPSLRPACAVGTRRSGTRTWIRAY